MVTIRVQATALTPMADKHPNAPNATKTATGETRENRGNDCASQQTCHSHPAGPVGSRRQNTPYERPAPRAVRTRLPYLTAGVRAVAAVSCGEG